MKQPPSLVRPYLPECAGRNSDHRSFVTVRRILRGSILAACILGAVSTAHGVILTQYNFGPDFTNPGVLTPTTVDPLVSATQISADPGVVLDLSSPATQPTTTPYLRVTFNVVSTTAAAAVTNNADFQ